MALLCSISKRIFLNSGMQRNGLLCFRLVSTSGRKEKAAEKACDEQESAYRKVPDFSKPLKSKNWISYGFDHEDKGSDRFKLHFMFFLTVSLFICGTAFCYAYYPDKGGKDWARREAFIRLHEREQLGLEPIDPNYIDPSKIVLPPDEELSEEEIVI